MNKKVINIVVGVLIVCLVGGGTYYFYKKSASAKSLTNNRYYSVAAKNSNIDVTVSGTGTVGAAQTQDVVANNTGNIENLNVNVGDTVTSGQTIATIASDTINQQVNKANLTVQQDQLAVSSAKAGTDQQKAELTLEADQSALQSAQEQQNAMTLTAPIGGLVVAKNNNNGDTVQQGKALISIADTSSLKVNLSVDELDISKVQIGQKADIKFDAISGKTYSGTVQSIAQLGTTNNNVTTYSVVVNVDNADSAIKLGMNANVNIKVTSKQNALVIPVEALIERNGNKYVMVQKSGSSSSDSKGSYNKSNAKNGNGSSRTSMPGSLVQVQTGLENENYVEITSGISAGQKVMVQLPQTTSTNSQNSRQSGFGGMGGFGGMSGGSGRQSQGGNSNKSSGK